MPYTNGFLVSPHVGVLFALPQRLTFSLAVGYTFAYRKWSSHGRDLEVSFHSIPVSTGLGYVF